MPQRKTRLKILFLCTQNSCRSQIAEGLTRRLKSDLIEAFSAGIEPAGVHPLAVAVMDEIGIDISGQRSKHLDELGGTHFDYVITLCESAAERCPTFPGASRLIHVGFDDPAGGDAEDAGGDAEDAGGDAGMKAFRKTRDAIREFIECLPMDLEYHNEEE